MAFRSLSRPSSAISALASTLRSSSLDLRFSAQLLRLFHHASNHLGFSNSLYFYFYYACFPVQFSSCALMKYLPKLSLGFARFSSALPISALLRHFKTIQNFRKNSISSLFRLSPALWTFVRGHVFFLRDLRSLNVSIPTCLFASSSMIPHFKSASTLGFEQLYQLLFSP